MFNAKLMFEMLGYLAGLIAVIVVGTVYLGLRKLGVL